MVAQQILLDEPACALPVGAEIDRHAVVDDDGKRGPDNGTRMRAGTIGPRQKIIQSSFHYHAGAVVFSEFHKLFAEPVSVADDRVDEVLGRLPLDGDTVFQSVDRIVTDVQLSPNSRTAERIFLLLTGVDDYAEQTINSRYGCPRQMRRLAFRYSLLPSRVRRSWSCNAAWSLTLRTTRFSIRLSVLFPFLW